MSTEFSNVKSGVVFTKSQQKQDLQSGDTIPQAFGKISKYMDVTDEALQNVQPILTFDTSPQYDSVNPVTSGGLYEYIELNSPTYIKTFSNLQEMYSYSGDLTNNDYAFINSGSGISSYKNVYQYKQGIVKHTIPNIRTTPTGTTVIENINDPALPSGNIMYELDCYITAVNNQAYGQAPVMIVVFSDNTSDPIFVQNSSKTHIQKQYTKAIKLIQFTNSAQASTGYTDFEDIKISTTNGWITLSYKIYDPTFTATQISTINSGLTASDKTTYDNHIQDTQNPHSVTKDQVGLGNVDNTSDLDKPVSNAVQTELNKTVTDVSYSAASKKLTKTINGVSSDVMVVDTVPSENSGNAVSSGGTYDFVNSSVATNTAYFIGTFSSVAELEAYTGTVTNNDYAFVTSTDSSGNTLYNRYKYNGSTQTWGFEYALNNTSFTTTQWATIQSGLTSADKTKLNGIETGANKTIVDSALSSSSTNPVQNKVINAALEGKQNTLTFDSTPTESSTNPVTSGGVYIDQQRQETEIGVVANAGAKNLLKFRDNVPSASAGNVYAKINADGTLSVGLTSGTTATAQLVFTLGSITNYRGRKLILSGCPTGGNYQSGYALYVSNDGSTAQADTGSGATLPIVTGVTSSVVALMVRNGTTISSELTFRPMVRDASIVDSTFIPYAKTNRELTVAEDEDRAALIAQVDGGAKNICNWDASTSTISGVTFTINSDRTVSTSGTATARSQKGLEFKVLSTLKAGRYVLSGCPTGGEQSGTILYCLYIWDYTANARVCSNDTGNGIEFDWIPDASHTYTITVDVRSGSNAAGLIFKPMICTAEDYAISPAFVPYTPTNRELYETKASISQVFGQGIVLKTTDDCNDITEVGMYHALSSSVIPASNSPFTNAGFRMRVEKWYQQLSGTAGIIQIADTYISSTYIEKRRIYFYTGGGVGWQWTDWATTISASMQTAQAVQSTQPTLMSVTNPMLETNETTEQEDEER